VSFVSLVVKIAAESSRLEFVAESSRLEIAAESSRLEIAAESSRRKLLPNQAAGNCCRIKPPMSGRACCYMLDYDHSVPVIAAPRTWLLNQALARAA
jgi:hypothetical protein